MDFALSTSFAPSHSFPNPYTVSIPDRPFGCPLQPLQSSSLILATHPAAPNKKTPPVSETTIESARLGVRACALDSLLQPVKPSATSILHDLSHLLCREIYISSPRAVVACWRTRPQSLSVSLLNCRQPVHTAHANKTHAPRLSVPCVWRTFHLHQSLHDKTFRRNSNELTIQNEPKLSFTSSPLL